MSYTFDMLLLDISEKKILTTKGLIKKSTATFKAEGDLKISLNISGDKLNVEGFLNKLNCPVPSEQAKISIEITEPKQKRL